MWFEILPSVGIIFTAMTLGGLATHGVPRLFLGKASLRDVTTSYYQNQYLRDDRLTGDPYTRKGLDAIPDTKDE